MTIKMLTQYAEEPQVLYTPEMRQYIAEIVRRCKDEVGWIGCGDRHPNNVWLIDEIYVLPQEVHATECEFKDDAVSEWAEAYIMAGGDTTRFVLWGHSHVDMSVSPSPPDYQQAAKYIKDCPKFICAIHNKKGHMRHDVYYRDRGVWFEDVYAGTYYEPMSEDDSDKLDATLKANVSKRTYKVPAYNGNSYLSRQATKNSFSAIQVAAFNRLPEEARDASIDMMKDAGFIAPRCQFNQPKGTNYLGLDLEDYWQYFIDTGEIGGGSDVYDHIYQVESGWKNTSYIEDAYGDEWEEIQ